MIIFARFAIGQKVIARSRKRLLLESSPQLDGCREKGGLCRLTYVRGGVSRAGEVSSENPCIKTLRIACNTQATTQPQNANADGRKIVMWRRVSYFYPLTPVLVGKLKTRWLSLCICIFTLSLMYCTVLLYHLSYGSSARLDLLPNGRHDDP
jgi:hypothetical protein